MRYEEEDKKTDAGVLGLVAAPVAAPVAAARERTDLSRMLAADRALLLCCAAQLQLLHRAVAPVAAARESTLISLVCPLRTSVRGPQILVYEALSY